MKYYKQQDACVGWNGSVAQPSSPVWTAVGGQQKNTPSGEGATIISELYCCIIQIFTLIHQRLLLNSVWKSGREWSRGGGVLTAACSPISVWAAVRVRKQRTVGLCCDLFGASYWLTSVLQRDAICGMEYDAWSVLYICWNH